jgi:hypothetical protein
MVGLLGDLLFVVMMMHLRILGWNHLAEVVHIAIGRWPTVGCLCILVAG